MPIATHAPDADSSSETPPASLAVVVASFRSAGLLHECLAALLDQCMALGAEVIVAREASLGDLPGFIRTYPMVRFVAVPSGASIPALRGYGLAATHATRVALIEDHCLVSPQWLLTLTRARGTATAVGGGMDNAKQDRLIDWGAYFSEYGFFDHQRREGPTEGFPLLTGANVLYSGIVVRDIARWMRDGEWENDVHQRLWRDGHVLLFAGDARVSQNLHYALVPFCIDRFEHGRDYASTRVAKTHMPVLRRAMFAAVTPLLPVVLLARLWRASAGSTRSRRATFVKASPFTLTFLTAWSVGECLGYVFGRTSPNGASRD